MWQFDSTIGLMVWEEVLSCLSRSDFSNHVKTFPVLHVSSQSQGGNRHGNIHQKCLWKFHQDLTSETMSRLHLSSKSPPGVKVDMDILDETWRWCQMEVNISPKCLWKFHQYLTTGTMSRLHLSSKSLPGFKEDMDIPDEPGDGDRWEGTSIRSVSESFIRIRHQEPCQDSTCPPSLFLDSRRTWTFPMDLEMVSDGGNICPKCLWKFNQDLTSGTMSRLHLSSKSLPGV